MEVWRFNPAAAEAPYFSDVAAEVGLDFSHWNGMTGEYYFPEMTGQGGAFFEVDNDGFLRNRGGGADGTVTFEDVTAQAGVDDPAWSTSAAFLDFDRDGWLDLFVTNYVFFDVEENPRCFAASSRRHYCGPAAFPGSPTACAPSSGPTRSRRPWSSSSIRRER